MIRPSRTSDLERVLELLQGAQLPTDDLTTAPELRFWVLEDDSTLVGVVGLERYATGGLLRSLVVARTHQRRGLARELVTHLEREARVDGVERLVLLTQTAEALFRRLGYDVINRNSAPDDVKQSAEFLSLCPASAVCMAKSLVP